VTQRAAPTLETARLRLRAHRLEDFEAILATVGDPEVMRHVSGPQAREDAWRRVLAAPGCWALLGYGYWVVERREDGLFMGQAGLGDFKRDMTPRIEGLPELGYVFAKHAHGQGFAGEAVRAILDWADGTFAPAEIVAIIDEDNAPSIRLAERAGFAVREPALYKDERILLFRRIREGDQRSPAERS
jgi:RimJ/RimL family protein N-acetyltransferase